MTDIIQDAKGLVKQGFTPPPWGVVRHDFGYDSHFIAGPVELPIKSGEPNIVRECHAALIAAAPELAQALAEESYFYGVQVWMGGRWIMMLTRDHGTSITHRGKWFERKHEAEECAAKWNHDTPTRIVRHRRSPVEVINE